MLLPSGAQVHALPEKGQEHADQQGAPAAGHQAGDAVRAAGSKRLCEKRHGAEPKVRVRRTLHWHQRAAAETTALPGGTMDAHPHLAPGARRGAER